MTNEALTAKFLSGVSKVAAISLAIGYPTQASLPHLVANAYKKLMAIAIEADLDIPQVKEFKNALANPVAAAPAAAAASKDAKPAAAAAPAKKEEEEEDAGIGFSLFD